MKIILNSYTGIGAWFILRLQEEGHSVEYYNSSKDTQNILRGLIPTSLKIEPDYSKYDLSIFDVTGKPAQAERSLAKCPTIGDSKLASQLEDDRLFGIEVMEKSEIQVPPYETFDSIEAARKFVQKTKKRYVFKPSGGQNQGSASTYVSKDWKDLLKYFEHLEKTTKGAEFLLQEFIEGGTEISTEAYFNGDNFFLINHTIEEKKFMNGNIGPATGCAGNLVWITTEGRPNKIFKQGLEKLKEFLLETGYRGMVDLNSIVTNHGDLFGLEWTPRFGYDASSTLFSLIRWGDLGNFLYAIAAGEAPPKDVAKENFFAASVRVSVPPYPSLVNKKFTHGIPIQGIEEDELKYIVLWDAMLEDGELIVAGEGAEAFVAAPIAAAPTHALAFQLVDGMIKKICIPDMQYRTDLAKYCYERYAKLELDGWLRP